MEESKAEKPTFYKHMLHCEAVMYRRKGYSVPFECRSGHIVTIEPDTKAWLIFPFWPMIKARKWHIAIVPVKNPSASTLKYCLMSYVRNSEYPSKEAIQSSWGFPVLPDDFRRLKSDFSNGLVAPEYFKVSLPTKSAPSLRSSRRELRPQRTSRYEKLVAEEEKKKKERAAARAKAKKEKEKKRKAKEKEEAERLAREAAEEDEMMQAAMDDSRRIRELEHIRREQQRRRRQEQRFAEEDKKREHQRAHIHSGDRADSSFAHLQQHSNTKSPTPPSIKNNPWLARVSSTSGIKYWKHARTGEVRTVDPTKESAAGITPPQLHGLTSLQNEHATWMNRRDPQLSTRPAHAIYSLSRQPPMHLHTHYQARDERKRGYDACMEETEEYLFRQRLKRTRDML